MAKSGPSLGGSILIGSDQFPEDYCEPCYAASDNVKPMAGYCQNCDEKLCTDCFKSHRGLKLFRNHKLVDKSTRPKTGSPPSIKQQILAEECHLHRGERIHAYCSSHSTVLCKVCLTIDHETCHTDKISKLARNIANSQELRNLNQKLSTLKKGFNDNRSKKGANEAVIKKNHRDALNEIKKLRVEFDKLMTETEKQADIVKAEDLTKVEKVSASCGILEDQIDKLAAQLETLTKNQANESLFIAMKRAENQLQSLKDKLDKLEKDNTVREYKFVPHVKLNSMLNNLNVLGQLSGLISQNVSTKADQKAKRLAHVKDIHVTSSSDKQFDMSGSLVLPNKQILISDCQNEKLKVIDTNQNKIISEIQLSGNPFDITKVVSSEVAVCVNYPSTIQFITVSQNSMSKVREVTVEGYCRGIAYNDRDNTLIVTFVDLHVPKIKILDMAGTEVKSIEHNSMGGKLFSIPFHVSLTPDKTSIYVTDYNNNCVTFMSLNGDVKAVYKDKTGRLSQAHGVYVHTSGLVYVVGSGSNTVHELDPDSGTFKVVLEKKDGLTEPVSISYCEKEDKIYIGMADSSVLKVFQMK